MSKFLAYFAGYLDGDGHFRFRKSTRKNGNPSYHCKIMITSTDERPLIAFKNQFGGSYYAKIKTIANWKQEFIYTLHIGREKFEEIKSIRTFLIEKKSQFDLIKEFVYGNFSDKDRIIEITKNLRNEDSVNENRFQSIKQCNYISPSPKDFIYLAGYVDAECCLTVTKKTLANTQSLSFSCHLRAGVTKYPCIKFLFTRFGGCLSYKRSKIPNYSDSIEWELVDKSLEPILREIAHHLISKKGQCELLISLRDTYVGKVFPRDKRFFDYYNHVTPIRESIFDSVKYLNKRGV